MVAWWIAPLLFSLLMVGITFLASREPRMGEILAIGVSIVGGLMALGCWFVFFIIKLLYPS